MPEVASISLLNELESRQDEILRQLDELDVRILAVIAEFSPKPLVAKPVLVSPPQLAPAIEMPRLADSPQQSHADGQAQKAA